MLNSPVWHPFTQHKIEPPMRRAVSARGAFIMDAEGNRTFDAISSWWVTTHGHRHPTITAAIEQAARTLDQVIFAEYTHDAAEQLARGLLAVAPPGLTHVFYSDSGSTAVEVALKMALGHFFNRGHKRHRIVVLEHSYHGDTIGTMSVGARGVFNLPFTPLMFEVERLPFPDGGALRTLDAFETLCRTGNVAALLIEPLVLGAGGMCMYRPALLTALRDIATRHGVLLIADEVMTGWGRTGTMFACSQAKISPDILCMSKGLTGGSLPLAATLATADIFESHLSTDRAKMFFHSSSYTANPIACAAGLANLEVWKTEPVQGRIDRIAHQLEGLLVATGNTVENPRRTGTIAAVDLVVGDSGYLSDVAPRLRAFFRSRHMLIRPLGNVVYLMPPYCSGADEIGAAWDTILEAAEAVSKGKL